MYTGLIMSFPCKKADLMSNACTIQFFPAKTHISHNIFVVKTVRKYKQTAI